MSYKEVFLSDLENEKWLPIKGYPRYEISNLGRVKSLEVRIKMPMGGWRYKPNIIMSPGVNNGGYLYVTLLNTKSKKTVTVHRLVALHFVKNNNPKKYRIIRHLNNNKKDNYSTNLDWTDHSTNNTQAYTDGLKKPTWTGVKGRYSLSAKPVDQFTKEGKFIKRHLARVEAANETGVPFCQINNNVAGRQLSAGGFVWRAVK